jgi:acetoin utilization protein AcuB
MRKTIAVRDYMSRLPAEIDRRERLGTALGRMETHEVRHLPVMDGAELFGILSRHDVLDACRRHGREADGLAVGDVCTVGPFTVSPVETIPTVAAQMVERGLTSALVVDGDVLVGIFTSTDALRVLADW